MMGDTNHKRLASLDWEIGQLAAFLTKIRNELVRDDEELCEIARQGLAIAALETASDLALEIDLRVMHRIVEIQLELKRLLAEECPEGDAADG